MKKILPLFSILIVVTVYLMLDMKPSLGDGATVIQEANDSKTYAIINVSVIPMTEEGLINENQTVMISNGKIDAVYDNARVKISPDIEVIDGTGKYLIPGLAEMHGHVPPTHPGPNAAPYFTEEYVKNTLFLYVSAGITTVRGMLGYDHQLELKDKVASGEYIGPNLYLAGPSFHGNTIHSPEQASQKAKQQAEEGWDLLKIHPGLTLEEYNSMAETANELGIRFGGHVPEAVGIERAIEAGQETMDHTDGYVAYLSQFEGIEFEEKKAYIIQKSIDHNVWIVPTQALWATIIGAADYTAMKQYDELKYIPEAVRNGYDNWVEINVTNNPNINREDALEHAELRKELLFEMNEAGVKILMGTDAPQLYSVPGFSIHRELAIMSESGMSNYDILKSGTFNVGEYFANQDNFGTIEEGKRADLILVNSNPLEDLTSIKDHAGVMVNGNWYSREMIDERLAEIEASYN